MRKLLTSSRLMFVSPWLIAASIALMTLIIVAFAINNLNREVNLIYNGLFLRGQSLARFVAAGTRASMMQGMKGSAHTQRLIEQVSQDPNIIYIAVVDGKGQVMAHSDPAMVGQYLRLRHDPPGAAGDTWHIIQSGRGKVFEVISDFSPFRLLHQEGGRGPSCRLPGDGGAGSSEERRRDASPPPEGNGDWCRGMLGGQGDCQRVEYRILVGLDMTSQEEVTRQARIHIVLLSAILFLVGLGGWFYLFLAQGYQASQKTLKHMQAFTNLLVMKLPVGIIATDRHGVIQTFNQAMAAMTGIEAARVVGTRPHERLPANLAGFLAPGDDGSEMVEQEEILDIPGRARRTVHVSSVPVLEDGGGVAGRVLLVHDVTKLKELEKEMTKHERLVALGKMAAGVAHEIRNPLSSIKGFATMLGASVRECGEGDKAARLLIEEVERLDRSITEMLNYSRPLPLRRAPVALDALLENSLDLIRPDAEEMGVEVRFAAADMPLVEVDEDRVKQVMLNLYLNALQAMESGGGVLDVGCRAVADGMVEIVVRDTGKGVPPEHLERVLEPYFTTKADGTGLGLALAYKIIDEHGGDIRIESEPGKGTVVRVRLPVR